MRYECLDCAWSGEEPQVDGAPDFLMDGSLVTLYYCCPECGGPVGEENVYKESAEDEDGL